MGVRYFERQFDEFLGTTKREETLLFTTFGLDESAFLGLLRRYRSIHHDQKIIVFHEVMRHRFPGLVSRFFKNFCTVSVCHAVKGACPVFHPKIWMKVRGRTCRELIVSSFNLTRFHLDQKHSTFESLCYWKDLNVGLPIHPLFNLDVPMGASRLRSQPCTIRIVTTHNMPSKIEVIPHSVLEVLEQAGSIKEERLLRCCAPFVSDVVLAEIPANGAVQIWDQTVVHGRPAIHAKCLEFERRVVLGSANLTRQALRGCGGQPRNTECVVCLTKCKPVLGLSRLLHSKPRLLDRTSIREPAEGFADPDKELEPGEPEDWKELKQLALNAPTKLVLIFKNQRAGRPHLALRIVHSNGIPRETRLQLRTGNAEKGLLLSSHKTKNIPPRYWKKLADTIVQAPVYADGFRGKKRLWTRQVDLGDFWLDVAELHALRNRIRNDSWRLKDQTGIERQLRQSIPDVRDVRDSLLTRDSIRHLTQAQERHRWLVQHTGYQALKLPQWCLSLAKQVRERRRTASHA